MWKITFFASEIRSGFEEPGGSPPPRPDQNGQSVYPFSDQDSAKTLPDGAAHTDMGYIREYPPPPGWIRERSKHFDLWTRCFLNWDSLVLDRDSCLPRHQFGISALLPQTSFLVEASSGIAKCRLFPQATNC